ncbi:hypothetical protein DFH08DRAFT_825401 [Mycena albidolilacea]|uniref:Uncharacterized protein n=1 Tax=Mycena albidolilacea TaxID=1033008 RepID=A0AAD6Z353_9AGAR|nr:hypothetical protein DFH08DRAFT_825401 [Mycena albidolilacea]
MPPLQAGLGLWFPKPPDNDAAYTALATVACCLLLSPVPESRAARTPATCTRPVLRYAVLSHDHAPLTCGCRHQALIARCCCQHLGPAPPAMPPHGLLFRLAALTQATPTPLHNVPPSSPRTWAARRTLPPSTTSAACALHHLPGTLTPSPSSQWTYTVTVSFQPPMHPLCCRLDSRPALLALPAFALSRSLPRPLQMFRVGLGRVTCFPYAPINTAFECWIIPPKIIELGPRFIRKMVSQPDPSNLT